MHKPLPHQLKPIELLKEKERFALYLSPGLGKTFISLYDWYNSDKKILLVLTLPTLIETWNTEVKKFFKDKDFEVFKLNKGSKNATKILNDLDLEKRNIILVSHNSSWRINELLDLPKKDVSITIDESHRVKNRASKQSKFAKFLVDRYNRVRLLTGTPLSVGWEDYFWPLKLLGEDDPRVKLVKSFEDNFITFENKTDFSMRSLYKRVVGYKNIDQLKDIINKTAIFMNEKSAGVKLPEQIEKEFYLEKDKDFIKAMRERTYNSWMVKNSGTKLMAHRTGASGFLYGEDKFGSRVVEKFPNQAKKDLFKNILEKIGDNKTLIFYNFEQEVEDILEICDSLKKKVTFINAKKVDTSGDIILTHFMSGSTGHNLQDIRHTIYYSPTLVGSEFIQSKKRTHRIGQEYPCYYYYLITKNSIEENIFEKIKKNEDYTIELFEQEYD